MVNLKVKEGASRSPDSQGEVPLREDHSEETLIRKCSFISGFKDPVSEFNEFKPWNQPYLSPGLNLNRGSISLNSVSESLYIIYVTE